MSIGSVFKNFVEGFTSIVDSAESKFNRRIESLEYKVIGMINKVKKKIYRSVFEIMFIGFGTVLLFIGAILFLSRYFSLDLVVIGFGVLALYVGLMFKLVK